MSKPLLFLSYNSLDHAAVESVRRALEAQGLATFLDRLDLPPGQPFRSLLEHGLNTATAVAVFQGPHGLGPWQQSELDLALVRQNQAKGRGEVFPVVPVLLPKAQELGLSFLTLNTWVDLRGGLDDAGALRTLALAATGQAPRGAQADDPLGPVPPICPYRSLAAFREEDADFFFGREEETKELLAKVRETPFVAVVGASGSGKSSLVRAGLLPHLRRQRSPAASWGAVFLAPGKHPFHRLAAALLPFLEPDLSEVDRLEEAGKLGSKLSAGSIRLCDVVDRLLDRSGGADRLLLVVDQFEELFTQSAPEQQIAFAEMLRLASEQSRLTVVITVRGDSFGSVLSLPRDFASAVDRGQMNLLAISRKGMAEVIETPAERVGLRFEPGLATLILDEVREEPGQLPLVEFALAELWQRSRPGSTLTLEAYSAVGRVSGAIAQRAQQFSASLSPPDRESLRRLMSRLVRVAERPEAGLDTRQRLRLSELPPVMLPLVRRLADVRLVVTSRDLSTGDETAEVAHEALIREWHELRAWLDQDRAFLLYRQDLQRAVERWLERGRSDDYVLQGDPLGEAERWRRTHGHELSSEQLAFLDAGLARRDRAQAENLARQRLLQRFTWTFSSASIGLGALLVVIFAINRQLQAHKTALSSQLLARRSLAELAENPQAAALLAREAVVRSRAAGGAPVAEAETALRAALAQLGGKPVVHRELSYDRRVLGAVLGKNGRWLATETRDGKVRLARLTPDAEVAEVVAPIDTEQGDPRWAQFMRGAVPTASVRFSPQGGWMLVRTVGASIELFRLLARPESRLTLAPEVSAVAFLEDDSALVLGGNSGELQWLDLTESSLQPVSITTLPDAAEVRQISTSPDGRWFAARSIGESRGLWHLGLVKEPGRRAELLTFALRSARPAAIPQRSELASEASVFAAERRLASAALAALFVGHRAGPDLASGFLDDVVPTDLAFAPDSRAVAFLFGDSVCYARLDDTLSTELPAACTVDLGKPGNLIFGRTPGFLAATVEGGLGVLRIERAGRNLSRTLVQGGHDALAVGSTVLQVDDNEITTLSWLSVPWGRKGTEPPLGSRGAWLELHGRQGDLALATIHRLQYGASPGLLASPDFLLAGLGKPTAGLATDEAAQWLLGWTSENEIRAWRPPSSLLPSFQPILLDDDAGGELAFTSEGDLVASIEGTKYGAHGHLWKRANLELEESSTDALLAERPSRWSVAAEGGRYFASVDDYGRLTRWDLSSEELPTRLVRLALPAETEISQVALAPTGRWFVAKGRSRNLGGSFSTPTALRHAVQAGEELLLWDLEDDDQPVAPVKHDSSGLLGFDPEGRWLVIKGTKEGSKSLRFPACKRLTR